jgi:hypothetical protein
VSIPVDVPSYLGENFRFRDVNLILSLQGRTLFYIAKWVPLSKKHRLQCIDALVPGHPVLRLAPRDKTVSSVYTLQGSNP